MKPHPAADASAEARRSEGTNQFALTYIVVSFHRPDSLERILNSVGAPDIEVIVANVENDPHIALLAGASALPVRENVGYAAAVNMAAQRATADIVIFSNDDIVISGASLRGLAGSLRGGCADVVVPRIETSDGALERTVMALPSPVSLLREWALLPDTPVRWLCTWLPVQKWRSPAVPEVVPAASAIIVATRRSLLTAIPLPDAYFLYWEESEWFTTLHRRGLRTVLDPMITVVHGQGRADVRAAKSALIARNAVRCIRRSRGRFSAALAWPVVVLWQARLTAVAVARHRNLLGARWAGLEAALAAWREV